MNINCEMAHDLLPMYKDKCLSPSSEAALREHLKGCDSCKKYLRAYKARQKEDLMIPSGDFSVLAKRIRRHRTVTEIAVGAAVTALAVYAVIKTLEKHTKGDMENE